MAKSISFDEIEAEFSRVALARDRREAEHSLSRLLHHYPNLELSFGRGKVFWRARKCNELGFDNESELSYPPTRLARVGRLNDADSPCLYLSSDPETAFAEIGVQLGDCVQLAGYRVLADKQIRVVAIGELNHVKKAGYLRITGIDPNNTIARLINNYADEDALRILYLDSYFASLLADPLAKSSDYLLTRTLCSLVYRRSPSVVGMFYPSVEMPLGLNLALLRKAADEMVHGVASVVVRITKLMRFGYFDYEVIRCATGVESTGRYQWNHSPGKKHIAIYRLCEEEYRAGLTSRRTLIDLPAHRVLSPLRRSRLLRLIERLWG